jgi:hypothetical protein
MRVVAKAASISWIPSESIASLMRLGMELGLSHWDDPPPDRILTLETCTISAAATGFDSPT